MTTLLKTMGFWGKGDGNITLPKPNTIPVRGLRMILNPRVIITTAKTGSPIIGRKINRSTITPSSHDPDKKTEKEKLPPPRHILPIEWIETNKNPLVSFHLYSLSIRS